MGLKIFHHVLHREQTMKQDRDLGDRQNGEISMKKNSTFPLPFERVRLRNNSIKLLNSITALTRLVPKKWSSFLNIKPQQEIKMVLFGILLARYMALLIILLLFGSSINLI